MQTTHTIELITRDGHALCFECGETESLLEAAARNSITLPSMCRAGSCGVCRANVLEGPYRLGDHSQSALSEEAAEHGDVLLCSTFPLGPLSLSIDHNISAVTAGPVPERQAAVVALEAAGGGVMRLQLKLEPDGDGNASASFEVGQYVELTPNGSDITRAYSMANTPNWEGLLEFYIRLQPEGEFSDWLRQAKVGDQIKVRGPQGSFVLNEASLNPRYFVAGGSGLAPILSMLRWMGELQAMQPSRLYFGVNGESELFALAELEALREVLPTLQIEICMWHPEPEWHGFTGTPAEALQRDLAQSTKDSRPDIYLCGPPALVDAVEGLTRSLGLDASQLYCERFLPA